MARRQFLLTLAAIGLILTGCTTTPEVEWNEFKSPKENLIASVPSTVETLDPISLPILGGDENGQASEIYAKANWTDYYLLGWIEPRRLSGTLFTGAVGSLMQRQDVQRGVADLWREVTPTLRTCTLTGEKVIQWNQQPTLVRTGECQLLEVRRRVEIRVSPQGNTFLIAIAKAETQEEIDKFFSSIRYTPPATANEPAPNVQEEALKKGNEFLEWLRTEADKAGQQR